MSEMDSNSSLCRILYDTLWIVRGVDEEMKRTEKNEIVAI